MMGAISFAKSAGAGFGGEAGGGAGTLSAAVRQAVTAKLSLTKAERHRAVQTAGDRDKREWALKEGGNMRRKDGRKAEAFAFFGSAIEPAAAHRFCRPPDSRDATRFVETGEWHGTRNFGTMGGLVEPDAKVHRLGSSSQPDASTAR